jgi:preprotein translocase subunit SecF
MQQPPEGYEKLATDTVAAASGQSNVNVSRLGTGTVRVQTEKLTDAESAKVRSALAEAFKVGADDVSATFIGPSWGASVSQKALQALVIFLLIVALVMAVYFRTWKMSLAALLALAHDMVVVTGIYALTGFEISPATMIGFLTVLGYSLYDTVVVFDKVRENTAEAFANGRMSFAKAANLAVNQTMVRSINTTVIGLLPIAAVMVVGWILIGAYSSIFIATPLLVSLRAKEERVIDLDKRAARSESARAKVAARVGGGSDESSTTAGATERSGEPAAYDAVGAVGNDAEVSDVEESTVTGRAVHKWAQTGPRNQPKKTPKSRR